MNVKVTLSLIVLIAAINIVAVVLTKHQGASKVEETSTTESPQQDIANIEKEEASGTIGDQGAFVQKVSAQETKATASEKSQKNQIEMQKTGKWIATDYAPNDIKETEYTVRSGDTLWEIAEAHYGNGVMWTNIVKLNKGKIGLLPSGQRAKIVPGVILTLG